MKRWCKKILLIFCLLFVVLAIAVYLYLQQPKFGTLPEGVELEKIELSANYINGRFENLIPTPQLVGGQSAISASIGYLLKKKERPAPEDMVPVKKTDLLNLAKNEDIVVWLGHSSYFIQIKGTTFLIDPVLSDSAAPIPFVNKAFAGANPYSAKDFPNIDYLLISHDHWDHLDYPTITELQPKIKNIICGLGLGVTFQQWGFSENQIQEGDWFKALQLQEDLVVHVLPARHYSGRMLDKNKTLWAGFAIVTPEQRIFYSGDSGYSTHFKEIGNKFGSFDLVLLDNGQYDDRWPYIHMTPEEAAQAAADLNAKILLPAHVGKFSIADHPWDEPFQRLEKASKNQSYKLLTPRIGEKVVVQEQGQTFAPWWETIQ